MRIPAVFTFLCLTTALFAQNGVTVIRTATGQKVVENTLPPPPIIKCGHYIESTHTTTDELIEVDDIAFEEEEENLELCDEAPLVCRIERMPQFPGGDAEMFKFLARNLKYPKQVYQESFASKVFVSYVINCDGSISDIEILRSVHPLLDEEVLRVVRLMPNWEPGEQRGVPVPVRYVLPINFCLY